MARHCLAVLSLALVAGAIGCAHCQTCDDFPTPCVGPHCNQTPGFAHNHGGMPVYGPPNAQAYGAPAVFGAAPVAVPPGMEPPVYGQPIPPGASSMDAPPASESRVGETPDPAPPASGMPPEEGTVTNPATGPGPFEGGTPPAPDVRGAPGLPSPSLPDLPR